MPRGKRGPKFLEGQLAALQKKLSECEERARQARERLSETEVESSSTSRKRQLLVEVGMGIEKISSFSTNFEERDGLAVSVSDEEMNVLLLNRCAEIIPPIKEAIRLLQKAPNFYGICLGCEKPIPEKRLRAIPWVVFCLRCQEKREE